MADTVTLNGTLSTATTLGLELIEPVGWQDAPPVGYQTIQLIDRPGAVIRSRRIEARTLRIVGIVTGSSNDNVKVKLTTLKGVVTQVRPVPIIIGDVSTRKVLGEYTSFQASPFNGMGNKATKFRVEIEFRVAAPPHWIETATTTVTGIGATGAALAQGTARPHSMIVTVTNATNPLLTLADSDAATIAAMQFTGSVTATEFYVIDVDNQTVYTNNTGATNSGTNAIDEWTSGDFLDLHATDWDYLTSDWPTLTCSSGTAEASYMKAYS